MLGASLGADKVIAAPASAWLAVGVALRGEWRIGEMVGGRPLHHAGLGAAATVELALRRLPVAVGARYEQGLTELVDGVREHAIVLELGGDLRVFHHAR